MYILSIISLIASLVTLLAVSGNIVAIYSNWKNFRNGGIRITYYSGAYLIKKGNLNGGKVYSSSDNPHDYLLYREIGKIEQYEDIPKFFSWKMMHWSDDIRMPQYPIRLL